MIVPPDEPVRGIFVWRRDLDGEHKRLDIQPHDLRLLLAAASSGGLDDKKLSQALSKPTMLSRVGPGQARAIVRALEREKNAREKRMEWRGNRFGTRNDASADIIEKAIEFCEGGEFVADFLYDPEPIV